MEAETTANVTETTSTGGGESTPSATGFGELLSKCGSCKENVQNRRPKLLACLHTFCQQCVSTLETGENGHITCSVCRQVSLQSNMIDNLFVSEATTAQTPVGVSDGDGDGTTTHNCTGCEENVTASHFCTDCNEWLCDPCAQAHRRVKVTKDHNIESVSQTSEEGSAAAASNVLASVLASKRRAMMCPTHPNEPLKLYCETCVKLTCRDCQLGEHRAHKYQFVQEAALACRTLLQTLLTKIREKQSHIQNAKSLIDRRHTEITQKERTVANEIKSFALSLISEINQRGRQLVGELQAVCSVKRRQLDQKNTEIRLLSDNLQHGLRFAEYLLSLTDDAALLYSRKTLMHQLSAILRTRCEVPNPYHVVDLRFNSCQSPIAANWSLGSLVVDGYQYGHRCSTVPSTTTGLISSSSTPSYLSSSMTARSQQLTGEQKLQKLQMMLQMQRAEQQRMLSQSAAAARPQVKHVNYSGSLQRADYAGSGNVVVQSQTPNQSSSISSSNQHRQDASGYTLSVQPKNYAAQRSISLSHLPNHHEQVMTTLQPIVIQPTNLPDHMTSPSPGSSTDVQFGYKPEEDNHHDHDAQKDLSRFAVMSDDFD